MQVEETGMTSSSRSRREFITCFFLKSQAIICEQLGKGNKTDRTAPMAWMIRMRGISPEQLVEENETSESRRNR
jgi:hypothetical protein